MRLAIVVPRYGPEIVGGAETLARGLAEHTAAAGLAEVDVLTSCVRDHQTWRNEFPAGAAPLNGVTVRRFPAVFTPAQAERWRVIHERLILNRPVTADEQYEWVDQSAHLPGLYAHLLRHGAAYDRLIFLPYLFGPTYYGSALFPERSIICPCLHDELYAYIQPTQDLFAGSRGIMFNSEPERQLAERLFGRHPGAAVVGLGLEPFTADADAARSEPSFEESLAAVERAIRALEAGDIPLEDSIDLYATAMQSLKRCHRVLDRAEGRLEIVRKSVEGGVEAVPAELKEGEGVQPAAPAQPPRGRPVREGPATA